MEVKWGETTEIAKGLILQIFPTLLTVTTKADFVIVSGKLIKIMPDSEVSSKIFFLIKK